MDSSLIAAPEVVVAVDVLTAIRHLRGFLGVDMYITD